MAESEFSNQSKVLETHTTLRLLSDIERERFSSQRLFSVRLGIAVGLTNAYVKRCIKKGWIKMRRVPARRYAYYVTPKGFAEKSKLVAEYLTSSFEFFRIARAQCLEILQDCERRGWRRVALYGHGELVEIATLAAGETSVELVAVIAPGCNTPEFAGLPVVRDLGGVRDRDAVLIADINDPQAAFDELRDRLPEERILTPPLLHVSRNRAGATAGRRA
ncbi:MAG: winged helix-turn-helix transcriptional regulator [Alphaproteobacteria bacterium]